MADIEKIERELRAGLASFDAEVAFQLENEGERADLWTDIDVPVEAIRALLDELSRLRTALASVRGMLEVEYHDDGRIACVAHESGGLREMVRLLDATLARALSEREGQE